MSRDPKTLAERVRLELVRVALASYEDAAMRGLCAEGAWEAAVSAMRAADLSPTLRERLSSQDH